MKYAADCEAAFGYFLHHAPSAGLPEEDDAAEQARSAARTRELYEDTFKVPYGAAANAVCNPLCTKGMPLRLMSLPKPGPRAARAYA
jgi:hypothetical protein